MKSASRKILKVAAWMAVEQLITILAALNLVAIAEAHHLSTLSFGVGLGAVVTIWWLFDRACERCEFISAYEVTWDAGEATVEVIPDGSEQGVRGSVESVGDGVQR